MKANRTFIRISNIWKRIYSLSILLSVVYFRKAWLVDSLKMKKQHSKGVQVDKRSIKKVWRGIKIDKGWIQFYNGIKRENKDVFDARYIPLDIQYCLIDDWFNDTQPALLMDDKNMYDMFFFDVKKPHTVARIVNNLFFDENYNNLSIEQVVERCAEYKHVIFKPSIGTSGGRGILFWDMSEGPDVLKKLLSEKNNYIIHRT